MTDYNAILSAFLFGAIVGLAVGVIGHRILNKAESVPLKIRLLFAGFFLAIGIYELRFANPGKK